MEKVEKTMMCKDCIHHDLCFDNGTLFLRYVKGIDSENVEIKCPFKSFKNKADFVEVVRCRDCEHAKYNNRCDALFCKLKKEATMVKAMDFCSYGERSDT